MCTFCGTAHLQKQLHSLLTQTLQPTELIVCDDNSTDGTVAMVEAFRNQAPFPVRIIINERNLGSTPNFDQAMQLANGDYLALCDQDDVWLPHKLSTLAKVLDEQPEVGGVFSDATLINAQGKAASEHTLWSLHGFDKTRQKHFIEDGAVTLLLKSDIVTGATLMVRSALRTTWHPIPTSWVHDGWMTWMLAIHSRIALVREPLVGYRIHEQQQLGIGQHSRAERLRHMRATERQRFASVANQFADLRHAIESKVPSRRKLLSRIDQKILFLRQRSGLSRNGFMRSLFVLSHTVSYRRFARGWRSMRKDLLLS
jgi:glycosyltransferase involved in cell wall biosynthesis